MKQRQAEEFEKQLLEDRGKYFRGTARIRFEHLGFEHFARSYHNEQGRSASLQYNFETYGCLRLEPKNRIPAIIKQEVLDHAIQSAPGVLRAALLNNPNGLPPSWSYHLMSFSIK